MDSLSAQYALQGSTALIQKQHHMSLTVQKDLCLLEEQLLVPPVQRTTSAPTTLLTLLRFLVQFTFTQTKEQGSAGLVPMVCNATTFTQQIQHLVLQGTTFKLLTGNVSPVPTAICAQPPQSIPQFVRNTSIKTQWRPKIARIAQMDTFQVRATSIASQFLPASRGTQ